MKCPKCEAEAAEGFRFCQVCGYDLKAPPPTVGYNEIPLGTIVTCPRCGASNSRTDNQCRNCEFDLTETKRAIAGKSPVTPGVHKIKCPFCGAFIDSGVRFCGVCGKDLSTALAAAADQVSVLVKVLMYVVSFVVPVVGVIPGAVFYVSRVDPNSDYRRTGEMCMLLSVVNAVISLLVVAVVMG